MEESGENFLEARRRSVGHPEIGAFAVGVGRLVESDENGRDPRESADLRRFSRRGGGEWGGKWRVRVEGSGEEGGEWIGDRLGEGKGVGRTTE